MKTQQITLVKEDVLSLGRKVSRQVVELSGLLVRSPGASFEFIQKQEDEINDLCLGIEEKCLDVLVEKQDLSPQEIRTVVGSTLIAAKFERLSDHAYRTAKLITWILEDGVPIPEELAQMANVIARMVEDVLVCFVSDAIDRVPEISQRDSQVDYLHDMMHKRLLSDLGVQDQEQAQTNTQFLFCARYLERMGDLVGSIARRIHFIVTGERMAQH